MFKELKCRACYIYVLDTLADWEIGFITAELNSGRYLNKNRDKPEMIKTGNTLKPIRTMGELTSLRIKILLMSNSGKETCLFYPVLIHGWIAKITGY